MRNVRDPAKQRGRLLRLIVVSVRLAWRADRRLFAASTALQLCNGALLALQILVIQKLLDAIIAAQGNGGSIGGAVAPVIALVLIMAITTAIAAVGQQWQRLLGELVGRESWTEILDVTTGVELSTYDSPGFYDHLQRVQTNAIIRPFTLTQALISLIGGLASTVGLAIAVFAIQPLLLPLMFIAAIPLYLGTRLGGRFEFRFAQAQSTRLRLRQYLVTVQTARDEAKEVRAFGLATTLRGRFAAVYAEFIADLRRHVRRRSAISLASSLASAAVLAATLLVIIWLVSDGRLSLASAGAGIVAVRLLASQITTSFSSVAQIYESGLFLEDLRQFVTTYGQSAQREDVGSAAPTSFDRVDVRDLVFTYPGADQPALRGIDMHLRRGQVVALVGENGSGKTTLAKLLAGLYRADSGQISWDGVDTAAFRPTDLRRTIAVIFQDFVHFQLSAADNVEFGRSEAAGDLARLDAATKRSGAHRTIADLPNGYDTLLSTAYDGGRDLSGGQWQRIALARAFYRDASFVILDEPSAALDPRAEHELFTSLRTLFAGRTVLFVSHRMATVREADQIYVMSEGRMVECGTHDELMRLDGNYAELFTLQAEAFSGQAPRRAVPEAPVPGQEQTGDPTGRRR